LGRFWGHRRAFLSLVVKDVAAIWLFGLLLVFQGDGCWSEDLRRCESCATNLAAMHMIARVSKKRTFVIILQI
jgi:hypothetical protein